MFRFAKPLTAAPARASIARTGRRRLRVVVAAALLALAALPPSADGSDATGVLSFVEKRLPVPATIRVPVPGDRQAATDEQLAAAFSATVAAFLAPPVSDAEKLPSLVEAACRVRPAQAARLAGLAADEILVQPADGGSLALEQIVRGAVSAVPDAAGEIVEAVLRSVILATERRARPLALSAAITATQGLVRAAVATVAPLPASSDRIVEISIASLTAATSERAEYLIVPALAAAVEGGRTVDPALLSRLVAEALTRIGRTRELAGLICIGSLRGAGVESVTIIRDQAAISLSIALGGYTTIVCNSFVAAAAAQGDPLAFVRFVTPANADFIPAALLGAISARPDADVTLLRTALDRDLVLHGRATSREILEAALLANPERAAQLAPAALDRGDLAEANPAEQLSEAVARSAPISLLSAAITALVPVQGRTAGELRSIVAGTMTGAAAAGRSAAIPELARLLAVASRDPALVLGQALVSAPPENQAAAVLGVMSADRARAAALFEEATRRPELASAQARLLSVSGPALLAMHRDPLGAHRLVAETLPRLDGADREAVGNLLLAAALGNPRAAPILAAAVALRTDLPAAALAGHVSLGDRAMARAAAETASAARQFREFPATHFHLVRAAIAADPEQAGAIVTAALIAQPDLAPVTAHAAALADPESVARATPLFFLLATPSEFSALTESLIRGVAASPLDAVSRERAVASVAAASVRSVLGLAAPGGMLAVPAARDAALGSVLGAAIRAAGSPDLAREMARAARESDRALDPAPVTAAILAASPASEGPRLTAAIAAAFAQADAQLPAAGVRLLLDYYREPLTGTPMTRSRDF